MAEEKKLYTDHETLDVMGEHDAEAEALWAEIDSVIENDLTFEVLDDRPEQGMHMVSDPGYLEMQETFLAMARNTLNPVTRYMNALLEVGYSYEILEMTDIIITSLLPQVQAVGLEEHVEDLTFFRSLIHLALGETDQHAKFKIGELVFEGFKGVEKRFDLKYRSYRLAVEHLVAFYRGMKQHHLVEESDIRKFFAIGVPSLTWVRRTKIEDMVSLSGISLEVMKEIRKLALLYHASKGEEASMVPLLQARKIQPEKVFDDEATLPPTELGAITRLTTGQA